MTIHSSTAPGALKAVTDAPYLAPVGVCISAVPEPIELPVGHASLGSAACSKSVWVAAQTGAAPVSIPVPAGKATSRCVALATWVVAGQFGDAADENEKVAPVETP